MNMDRQRYGGWLVAETTSNSISTGEIPRDVLPFTPASFALAEVVKTEVVDAQPETGVVSEGIAWAGDDINVNRSESHPLHDPTELVEGVDVDAIRVKNGELSSEIGQHLGSAAVLADSRVDEPVPQKQSSQEPVEVKPDKKDREHKPKVVMRAATVDDIDRLVELDLRMFKGAYGERPPTPTEVREMFYHRFANVQNGRGLMYVCEVDGRVEAFATYFKTKKSWEDFISWEESTGNGTLDRVTDPNGEYAYVVNLTVGPRGSAVRARERLTASMMAHVVKEGKIKQAHFVSRMPQFAKWLENQGIDYRNCTEEELDRIAQKYSELRRPKYEKRRGLKAVLQSSSPKLVPYDYELRMYESMGFERGKLVKGAFGDPESLNYGVLFRINIPGSRRSFIVRRPLAALFRFIGNHEKLAAKVF